MKRRIRRVVNFFAFNLLFFALYLNFIHKDNPGAGLPEQSVQATASVKGTVPVAQPEKYLEPKTSTAVQGNSGASQTANLSIN
ncbi:MAG: hypothetical protein JNN00_04045 [Chitinophagaceae bacterium]|nr:hypothetical protein [Chitinophagaceae bacterium]